VEIIILLIIIIRLTMHATNTDLVFMTIQKENS
jgi:hypothetical protein